jgi:peptidoglycan/xylan/chitin deacetylase (PgdA/CDA1 family)
MDWGVWSGIETALEQRGLKPIVAVVPDNQDPALKIAPPVRDFWDRVRAWSQRGWTIALHGFQHRYVTCHPGVVTTRKKSEFAGLPASEQEEKLRRGMAIFEREGIRPRVWIAPSNSFDQTTVQLLSKVGISIVCDGNFRFPFVCQNNLTWVPHQIFGFRPAPAGVWTVCYHHNQWTAADAQRFREDLDHYGPHITSLDAVLQDWSGHRSWWSSFLCTSPRLSPLVIRAQLKLTGWQHSLGLRFAPSASRIPGLASR